MFAIRRSMPSATQPATSVQFAPARWPSSCTTALAPYGSGGGLLNRDQAGLRAALPVGSRAHQRTFDRSTGTTLRAWP